MRRKFFRAVWSQKLRQKMGIFQNFGASFWTSSQWIFSFFSFATVLYLQIAFNLSYGHELTCARYVWYRRTFHILITWLENASKKFLGSFEVKNFVKNMSKRRNFEASFWTFSKWNFHFFRFLHFYAPRLILIRRTVTNQRALDSFELGEHFAYP